MNVLSLFDGMSCGRIALERSGLTVDNYFASEIDKHAIKVSESNYPDIIRLGDVTKIDASKLPKIDILLGGTPCQGFSFAGKQLNFEDPRSKLFFEFVRLLKETNPRYFLLENVNMKKEYQDIITNELGVEPIKINSNLVSAQNRNRLYWTNIPNVKQPEDKGIYLIDIIEEVNIERVYVKHIPHGYIKEKTVVQDKYPTLCSQDPSSKHKNYVEHKNDLEFEQLISEIYCPDRKYWSEEQIKKYHNKEYKFRSCYRIEDIFGKCQCLMAQFGLNHPKFLVKIGERITFRRITPIECERLQTVPDNYTNYVSNNQRYKMLGNGWTVDVISHILNHIP